MQSQVFQRNLKNEEMTIRVELTFGPWIGTRHNATLDENHRDDVEQKCQVSEEIDCEVVS